jgi:hypothetical protein
MSGYPTRIDYRPGQNLSSALFRAEQDYHLSARERHNVTAHEWGTVFGLALSAEAVELGAAVDGYGRELVLPVRTPFDARAAFTLLGVDAVDVHLVFGRAPSGDLVVERPRIVLDRAAGPDTDRRQAPPGVDDAVAGIRGAPHDQTHPWPVYLGTLSRDPADPDAKLTVRTDGRPYIGVRAARVNAPDGSAELELGAEVSLRTRSAGAAVLRWTPENTRPAELTIAGDLDVTGGVTVTGGPVRLESSAAGTVAGWKIQHVRAKGEPEQLRVVLGNASGSTHSELVIGSTVEGTFTPCLTVAGDGTVTVHGNLVVNGSFTPPPPVNNP